MSSEFWAIIGIGVAIIGIGLSFLIWIHTSLSSKIDGVSSSLSSKIDNLSTKMDQRLDKMDTEIKQVRSIVDEMRGFIMRDVYIFRTHEKHDKEDKKVG